MDIYIFSFCLHFVMIHRLKYSMWASLEFWLGSATSRRNIRYEQFLDLYCSCRNKLCYYTKIERHIRVVKWLKRIVKFIKSGKRSSAGVFEEQASRWVNRMLRIATGSMCQQKPQEGCKGQRRDDRKLAEGLEDQPVRRVNRRHRVGIKVGCSEF